MITSRILKARDVGGYRCASELITPMQWLMIEIILVQYGDECQQTRMLAIEGYASRLLVGHTCGQLEQGTGRLRLANRCVDLNGYRTNQIGCLHKIGVLWMVRLGGLWRVYTVI